MELSEAVKRGQEMAVENAAQDVARTEVPAEAPVVTKGKKSKK